MRTSRVPATVRASLLGATVGVGVLGLLGLVGCDTQLGVGPDAGGTPDAPASCLAANNYSDLPTIEESIFKRQCSFGPCHDNVGTPAEMLVLLPGLSYAELVNVPSIQQPDMDLVEPGDPDRSYIMIKLGEGDQSLRKKTIMPQGSIIGMCQQKRDSIRRWIEAGAPAEELDAAPIDAAPLDGGGPDAAGPDAAPIDARIDATPPDAP